MQAQEFGYFNFLNRKSLACLQASSIAIHSKPTKNSNSYFFIVGVSSRSAAISVAPGFEAMVSPTAELNVVKIGLCSIRFVVKQPHLALFKTNKGGNSELKDNFHLYNLTPGE